MAIMPGSHFLDAVRGSLMSRFDVVCVHTIVGYAPANAAHFSTNAAGYLWQSRDTRYTSAANYQGNHRVIAIENEDHGAAYGAWNTNDGHQVPGFTAAQIETIAKVCAWAHQVHGIPLVLCPNSLPGSRGIAYHRQGIDGNWAGFAYGGRVAGGEVWSTSTGKVCPGDRRITQLITQIIPRARQLAGLEEDPMAIEDVENMMWKGGPVTGSVAPGTLIANVEELERLVWKGGAVSGSIDPGSLFGRFNAQTAKVTALEAKVDALSAKLDALVVGQVDVAALAAELLPALEQGVNNEADRRARDNDPATGPRS